MNNEQMIKDIADYHNLPVEQVAMLYSVIEWLNDELRPTDICLMVDTFLDEKKV